MIARSQKGFGLIEIVVASSIIAVVVTGIAGALQMYIKLANTNGRYAQAALLTEEGSEAMRILRDTSWSTKIAPLSLNTTYYLYWTGSQYAATTTLTAVQNSFVRTVSFAAVNRDTSDNISTTTGTLDANTRKVTIAVAMASSTSNILMRTDFLIHNVYSN